MEAFSYSVISAIIGAVVGSVVTVLGTYYFLYSASRPKFAECLRDSIKANLAWLVPDEGTSVYGTIDPVSPEDFHNFLSVIWPWQKRKPRKAWRLYQEASSRPGKAEALRDLLDLVNRLSGHA